MTSQYKELYMITDKLTGVPLRTASDPIVKTSLITASGKKHVISAPERFSSFFLNEKSLSVTLFQPQKHISG